MSGKRSSAGASTRAATVRIQVILPPRAGLV
jgi:hypothetical protein